MSTKSKLLILIVILVAVLGIAAASVSMSTTYCAYRRIPKATFRYTVELYSIAGGHEKYHCNEVRIGKGDMGYTVLLRDCKGFTAKAKHYDFVDYHIEGVVFDGSTEPSHLHFK